MTLEELRATEDTLRAELEDARAKLASAIAALKKGATAEDELAGIQRGKREGAYRDVAKERAHELLAQVSAAKAAVSLRARLRATEAMLLERLEKTRLDIARSGIERNVLPVLDGIASASPCSVRWDDMKGDGDARVCAHCKTTVLSLAMLEPAEAERLLGTIGREALYRRVDGTVLAGDCHAGASRQRFLMVATGVILGFVAVMGGVIFSLAHMSRAEATHGRDGTDAALGLVPDMHQFSGERPEPAVPTRGDLKTATTIKIEENNGMPHRTAVRGTIQRHADRFTGTLECNNGSTRTGSTVTTVDAPAALVDAFLGSVARHKAVPDALEDACDTIGVAISVEAAGHVLSINNASCSRQWKLDGAVLDDAAGVQNRHKDINEAYEALRLGVGVQTCLAALPKGVPALPNGVPARSEPPRGFR